MEGGTPAKVCRFWDNDSFSSSQEGLIDGIPLSDLPFGKHCGPIEVRLVCLGQLGVGKTGCSYIRGELRDELSFMKFVAFAQKATELKASYNINGVVKIKNFKVQESKPVGEQAPHKELVFTQETLFEASENPLIPKITLNISKIRDVHAKFSFEIVDVIGIVCDIAECTQAQGTTRKSRILKLIDGPYENGVNFSTISVKLWGDDAQFFVGRLYETLAIKSGNINNFNGVSINTTGASTIWCNPDVPEAKYLKEWFQTECAKHSETECAKQSESECAKQREETNK